MKNKLVTIREKTDQTARRQAAVDKLKSAHGLLITQRGRTDELVASYITQVEPGIAGDAEQVIRTFIAQKPTGTALVRERSTPKRAYSPAADGRMAAVMARLGDTPKPASITSKVPNSAMVYR